MTKITEFSEAEFHKNIQYVNELWDWFRDTRTHALTRITSYMFILNSGALLAALTYVATKGAPGYIKTSIWFFAFGILCSVSHAAIDYYVTEFAFGKYRNKVKSLYEGNIEWESFIESNKIDGWISEYLLHILGWSSGILFIAGMFLGIKAIPST